MLINLTMGLVLLAQAGSLAITDGQVSNETREVAYETLSAGHASQAVRDLEALRAQNPDDPALLINLGSAYAAMGDMENAESAYRAAAASDVRYQLELDDGSWIDSRRAARAALRNLENYAVAMN